MNSTTCLILLSNQKLASGHEDGKIKIWNTINGDLIKIFISAKILIKHDKFFLFLFSYFYL